MTQANARSRKPRRNFWYCALAPLALCVPLVAGCAVETEPPSIPAPVGPSQPDEPDPGPEATEPVARCTDGETRECTIILSAHQGVVSCFEGEQICTHGVWSPCAEPTDDEGGEDEHDDKDKDKDKDKDDQGDEDEDFDEEETDEV